MLCDSQCLLYFVLFHSPYNGLYVQNDTSSTTISGTHRGFMGYDSRSFVALGEYALDIFEVEYGTNVY